MNKRIQKKLEKKAELAHEEELSGTSWGRITLSFEHLRDAFDEFLTTLGTELGTLESQLRGRLRERAQVIDHDLAPQVAKVPVVGPKVARGIHEFATSTS